MSPLRSAAQSGQTTLELSVTAALISITLVGAGWLIRAQWDRAKCAYLVFESTHATRAGRLQKPSLLVSISTGDQEFTGVGLCGKARETVRLRKLENAKWD